MRKEKNQIVMDIKVAVEAKINLNTSQVEYPPVGKVNSEKIFARYNGTRI